MFVRIHALNFQLASSPSSTSNCKSKKGSVKLQNAYNWRWQEASSSQSFICIGGISNSFLTLFILIEKTVLKSAVSSYKKGKIYFTMRGNICTFQIQESCMLSFSRPEKKNETSYYSLSNSMKFDKGMLSQEINLSNADIEKKCCKKYSWLEGGKKKFFARCTLERCLGGIARENVCHKSSQASFFPFFIFYLIHTCILLHWPRKLWVGLV